MKVDIRLPGAGNSNAHGARPVHQIILMIKWTRTRRLSIKNSLSAWWRYLTADYEEISGIIFEHESTGAYGRQYRRDAGGFLRSRYC